MDETRIQAEGQATVDEDVAAGSALPHPAASLALPGVLLSACGGGGSDAESPNTGPAGANEPRAPTSARDAARFLSQAGFGPRSMEEVQSLQRDGFDAWFRAQWEAPVFSHLAYLEQERHRHGRNKASDEMSYEAVWQQWLQGSDVLRSRVSWALLQIFVISNIAPDLRPHAMSSYMDLLNRHAFGNYRALLQDVTLHPAMGYYLNLLESAKEDPLQGTHPNENYAREVLQLFSIGLVRLNADGSAQLDAAGKPVPSYDEAVVKGFARAFSGYAFGGLDNSRAKTFHHHDDNVEAYWTQPMQAWAMFHDDGAKTLLDGRVLPAGQTPARDLADALDCIFMHPNVGPFIGRQLIQRLVTSNPSPAYVQRVAAVFADNGQGVRGDLRAVVRALLLDPEARAEPAQRSAFFGKQREPVLRLAQVLRALNARSASGGNRIHDLNSADDALGQSPLLAPSVFNFYAPDYSPPGPLARAGLVAPEFQITNETTMVGALNFMAKLVRKGGYGWGDEKLMLDYEPLLQLAGGDAAALIERLDLLLCDLQMSASTRQRLAAMLAALPARSSKQRLQRVRAALTLLAISPDHVIQ